MNTEKKLKRYCDNINRLLKDVQKEYPKACLYLDGLGNLHLMSGPHHLDSTNSDVFGEKANFDAIIATAQLNADGGDW